MTTLDMKVQLGVIEMNLARYMQARDTAIKETNRLRTVVMDLNEGIDSLKREQLVIEIKLARVEPMDETEFSRNGEVPGA